MQGIKVTPVLYWEREIGIPAAPDGLRGARSCNSPEPGLHTAACRQSTPIPLFGSHSHSLHNFRAPFSPSLLLFDIGDPRVS